MFESLRRCPENRRWHPAELTCRFFSQNQISKHRVKVQSLRRLQISPCYLQFSDTWCGKWSNNRRIQWRLCTWSCKWETARAIVPTVLSDTTLKCQNENNCQSVLIKSSRLLCGHSNRPQYCSCPLVCPSVCLYGSWKWSLPRSVVLSRNDKVTKKSGRVIRNPYRQENYSKHLQHGYYQDERSVQQECCSHILYCLSVLCFFSKIF